MKLRIFITLYIICMPVCLLAQRRQLQEARAIIKSGKNYDQAEEMMTKLLEDSANLYNPRIYDMWLLSVEKQYDQVNEKMYKKQEVDTTEFFNLTRRLFTIGERLDSLDMRPDKKGRVNPSYRSDNARRLTSYRPNLYFGGAYHLRRDSLQMAYDFFEMYLDCDRQPLFTGYDFWKNDPRMATVAYWATYTGYRMGDPVLTLRYAKEACRDTAKLEYTLQYIAQSWKMLKDENSYVATLKEGVAQFPKSPYFFPRLMDHYMEKGNYEKGLSYAESALQTDSLNELFLLAKSTMLLAVNATVPMETPSVDIYAPQDGRQPQTMPRIRFHANAVNPNFGALLIPLPPNTAEPKITAKHLAGNVLEYTIQWPSHTDTIRWNGMSKPLFTR